MDGTTEDVAGTTEDVAGTTEDVAGHAAASAADHASFHPLAVIVVDHGSRRSESNEILEAFVHASAERLPYPIVEPAHMELAEPSIATAFDRCVAAGAATVVIAPYFLGPGNHWDRDIPALATSAAARHPGVRWLVAPPLGPDPQLMDIVDRRVSACLAHVAGTATACSNCAGTDRCQLR